MEQDVSTLLLGYHQAKHTLYSTLKGINKSRVFYVLFVFSLIKTY